MNDRGGRPKTAKVGLPLLKNDQTVGMVFVYTKSTSSRNYFFVNAITVFKINYSVKDNFFPL